MKVVIDFDNTFYIPNRDIDDGLALMYLLGSPEVDLVGITSTFGNASIKEVDRCTRRLMSDLAIQRIPYARGAKESGDYLTPASKLLSDLANQYAGELAVIAVGSMTNLHGAYLRNRNFFKKVKQIVLMGGVTQPLIFDNQEMLELNFSCDPQASFTVLTKGNNVSTLTGNNCLDLLFTRDEYERAFAGNSSRIASLIQKYAEPWFIDNEYEYGIKGFYNWDSLAAVYLVNPALYEDQWTHRYVSIKSLSSGSLNADDWDPTTYARSRPFKKVYINTPRVKKDNLIRENLFQRWLNVKVDSFE
ncbi:nucleoside hydrolase [Facklamia miroungae]|uniref:Inosine-uridine nucleoside N-ribohydrolase n=1 Tax=Facklamia miroungae TaxID=120956 RepID=A0A1G7QNZ8_9LACT|nr:nucleoside hydrolase [Facklamia miroungae]NKZ29015.1 nucleoside hydrolase [Facklamia miroungae]SDG00267.1 Inosine-uridine nucleoside N-ribohydrolase [Facklamia miroungae]